MAGQVMTSNALSDENLGKVSGIIAEFNPFHHGHQYLLSQAPGLKIVIMSGNWMQRGEPAIVDKWTRAQMALKNGADIIVELPFFASVQGADYFAQYAVQMLADLGIDQLVFGTDSDVIAYDGLRQIYHEKETEIQAFIADLPDNLSYPQKMQEMWQTFAGVQFDGNTPNHILALAYTKAVAAIAPKIQLQPVKRKGAGFHDDTLSHFASATAIREHADEDLSRFMPDFASFQVAPKVQWSDYFPLLNYQLLSANLTDIFQVNDELAVRLKSAIKTTTDFESLVDVVATKRYTKARVRRLLTYILVNVPKSQVFEQPKPHVLGFSAAGQRYLKQFDVVTKVGKTYQDTLSLQADAIYRLGNPAIPEQNYGRPPLRQTHGAAPEEKSVENDAQS
ncbi:nucleotidyltransferase [Pseudolactococcus yaeyamensis]